MPNAVRCASTILYCADARRLADFIPPDSIDLVVTSPPTASERATRPAIAARTRSTCTCCATCSPRAGASWSTALASRS